MLGLCKPSEWQEKADGVPTMLHGEQGCSCVSCFPSAGERFPAHPLARAASSPQAVLSSSCEEAAVVKLWLSWVGRRRRNHLFRNQADRSDCMSHLTSTELHLLAWVISFLRLKDNLTL